MLSFLIYLTYWRKKKLAIVLSVQKYEKYFYFCFGIYIREFAVLKSINDHYPKYVIRMDTSFGKDVDGIRRVNMIDFLLEKDS